MKLLSILSSLAIAMFALNFTQSLNAHEILDKQVSINSIEDLDRLTWKLRAEPNMRLDWDAFSQAVTYITAYVSAENTLYVSANDKNCIVKMLVSGRTLREIIILGHVIWLEQIKQEIAKDNQSPNTTATDEKGLQLAKSFDLGHAKNAREVIRRYLEK